MHPPASPDTGTPAPDPANDTALFRSPRTAEADSDSNTNTPLVKRGIDLYARRDADGTARFFVRDWSQIPGEEDWWLPVSEEFAVFFIQDVCCRSDCVPGLNHETLMEYLPCLYRPGLFRAAEKECRNMHTAKGHGDLSGQDNDAAEGE